MYFIVWKEIRERERERFVCLKIENGLRFYFEKYFIVNLLVKYLTMKQALKNAKII